MPEHAHRPHSRPQQPTLLLFRLLWHGGNGCEPVAAAAGAAALIGLGKGQQRVEPMKEHCSKIQNVTVQSWIGRKAGLFQLHFTENLKFDSIPSTDIMLKMAVGHGNNMAAGPAATNNNNQTDLLDLVPTDLANSDHSRRSGFTFGQRNHNRWELSNYSWVFK